MTSVGDGAALDDDVGVRRAETRRERVTLGVGSSVAAVLAALVLGAVVLLVSGKDPLAAYGAILDGALGSKFALGETLSRAAPLAIVGYGSAVALRAGVVTIGAQGQVTLGAVGALLAANLVEGAPSAVAIPVAVLGGTLFGAGWVLIPALLRAYLNVNEILSTLLFTEFAALLITYLLNNPMKPDAAITPQSDAFPDNARPGLLIDGTRLHAGVLLALLALVLFAWWVRSPRGFEYDLHGENPRLARSLGISSPQVIVRSLLISGAAAGVVGWMQGAGLLGRLYPEIASDIGFFGLVIAFVGGTQPLGILTAALLFGGLKSGGLAMENAENIPASLSDVIQALILLGFSLRYAPRIARLMRTTLSSIRLLPRAGE